MKQQIEHTIELYKDEIEHYIKLLGILDIEELSDDEQQDMEAYMDDAILITHTFIKQYEVFINIYSGNTNYWLEVDIIDDNGNEDYMVIDEDIDFLQGKPLTIETLDCDIIFTIKAVD